MNQSIPVLFTRPWRDRTETFALRPRHSGLLLGLEWPPRSSERGASQQAQPQQGFLLRHWAPLTLGPDDPDAAWPGTARVRASRLPRRQRATFLSILTTKRVSRPCLTCPGAAAAPVRHLPQGWQDCPRGMGQGATLHALPPCFWEREHVLVSEGRHPPLVATARGRSGTPPSAGPRFHLLVGAREQGQHTACCRRGPGHLGSSCSGSSGCPPQVTCPGRCAGCWRSCSQSTATRTPWPAPCPASGPPARAG